MTDDYTSQSHKLEENPGDYEQHIKVLTVAEKLSDAAKIRRSYESLLSEFPLLHSYWKKFADFELNQGDYVKARQVCERGLSSKAALHSVDLWTYYCGMVSDRSNDTNEIRSMFERASNNVGDDFAAHQLWDKFLEFEMVREDYLRVRQLFDRILATPLEKTSSYFDKFKKFLNERKVADLLTNDELKQLEAEQGSGEAQQKMKVLAARDDVFKKTLEQVKRREPFEIIIAKRAGFSMTPVNDEVLTAWRQYLEAEEKRAESNVRKLYERCVLSCGNYPEFWRRYIYYLEKTDEQLIEDVFQRASVILKRRPELQLEHALYAESRGQRDRAEQIYQTLLKNISGHIESSLRYIHFKRRTVPAECAAMYAKLLTDTTAPAARTLVAIEYARFLEHVTGDIERARAVFANESSRSSSVLELWLSWLHFELRHRTGTERETAVTQLCTQALQGDSLVKLDRVELLRAWLDVVECCGTDLTRERQISRDLLLLSADQNTNTVSKKRSSDHAELEQSPRPNKQSKQDDPSNYAANQAYDQYYQNYASYPGYANYYQGNYVNYQ